MVVVELFIDFAVDISVVCKLAVDISVVWILAVVEGRNVVSAVIDVILVFCCVVPVAPSVVVTFSVVFGVSLGVDCVDV